MLNWNTCLQMIDLTTNSGDMKKDNEREEEDRVMSEELIPRLMNNTYQDYFEEDGEIIAGREDNYKAFVWFVKNVLSAINFERNNKRAKKVYDEEDPNFISGVYSVTDEAFGLLMLKNYEKRWRNQVKFPRYKLKDLTKEEKYMAQFTSSLKENAKLSWSGEGIRQYNEWMDKVEVLRGQKKQEWTWRGSCWKNWKRAKKEAVGKEKMPLLSMFQKWEGTWPEN
jgi:hypothetical protein